MQEKELMLQMKKTYKLDQIDNNSNSPPLSFKKKINTEGEMEIKCKNDSRLKKHKKKHKKDKRGKLDLSDIVEAKESNKRPTTTCSESTNCKENLSIPNGTKKLKNKSQLKCDLELNVVCDNVPTDEVTSKEKVKKAKKKRKANEENDDSVSIRDKKRNKEM